MVEIINPVSLAENVPSRGFRTVFRDLEVTAGYLYMARRNPGYASVYEGTKQDLRNRLDRAHAYLAELSEEAGSPAGPSLVAEEAVTESGWGGIALTVQKVMTIKPGPGGVSSAILEETASWIDSNNAPQAAKNTTKITVNGRRIEIERVRGVAA